MTSKKIPTLVLLAGLILGGPGAAGAETFVTIGTGGVTGVYYPAGRAICRLVDKFRQKHGIRCAVESTGGSVYNLNAVRAGLLDMGVVQSDWQYHAVNGTSKYEQVGPDTTLRSVFSIHSEPFTVVVRADSGIRKFEELKGKRVNIGNPGSGQRGTMEVAMSALGWTTNDFSLVSELNSAEQSQALCNDKIDAMVFTVGHPSGSIREATTSCDTVIIDVTSPAINKLVADNDYYHETIVPGGMYRANEQDVHSFGMSATLVTSTRIPEETIYQMVKVVFENLDEFRMLHPAFANLKKEQMIRDGLSAPLHAGALRYYKEVGLL